MRLSVAPYIPAVVMSLWAQLETQARPLHAEEPAPHFLPVRYAERIHEPGYDVCPCGKLLTDLRSKSMHQAWCRTMTRSRESERSLSLTRLLGG